MEKSYNHKHYLKKIRISGIYHVLAIKQAATWQKSVPFGNREEQYYECGSWLYWFNPALKKMFLEYLLK